MSAASTAAWLALLILTGCEALNAFLGADPGDELGGPLDFAEVRRRQPDVGSRREPFTEYDPNVPIVPVGPLDRADIKLPFPATGSTNLGFKLRSFSGLRALAAAVEVPSWSAPSQGDPEQVRDDDIDTVWPCAPTPEQRCAIGLHFPSEVTLSSLRLYASAGPTADRYAKHPRIKRLRVHTEEGFTDALLPDERTHIYVALGKSVRTRNLSIEVLETHGDSDNDIHIAELEAYGSSGAPRAPWNLDPTQTFVSFEQSPWKPAYKGHELETGFVHTIRSGGKVTRFANGSALLGRAGDRFLLLERAESTNCKRVRGTFSLIDQTTRVVAPLGELGGVGADFFRHREGLGVALGYDDASSTTLEGVLWSDNAYVRKSTPIRRDKVREDTFGAWEFDSDPVPRGGFLLDSADHGCTPPTPEQLAGLGEHERADPAMWRACDLDEGAVALATDHGTCADVWELYVLDAHGKLVTTDKGRGKGSLVRLAKLSDGTVAAEITTLDGRSTIRRLHSRGIDVLADPGAFAVPLPGSCREPCTADLPNPLAPQWD